MPATTKILIGEVTNVDESEPFAHEKLSPTLAMYRAKDFEDAVAKAEKLVAMGGIGHTSCLYTDQGQPAGSRGLLRPNDENRAYPDQHPGFSGWYR
ncbi:alcohol dehydrogenase [Klebsiella pneumoniae subsp. rhinoscleromatis]|nr:alcohol dehydrogenase [Klebsiella pneumoniae subsp. rhinoscleromatis]